MNGRQIMEIGIWFALLLVLSFVLFVPLVTFGDWLEKKDLIGGSPRRRALEGVIALAAAVALLVVLTLRW